MNRSSHTSNGKKQSLRPRAEALYRRNQANIKSLKNQEVQELVHELQVHQIELEMQNEDLLKAQSEIDEAHERYVELYNAAPVGYITSDPAGGVVMVNQTIAEMLRTTMKDLKKGGMARFCKDQDAFYLHCRKALKKKRGVSSELYLLTDDGVGFWASIESKAFLPGPKTEADGQIRSIIIDISEKKQLEEELRRTQKLELVGVLAGGIAHDFNNILGAIMGNVELAKRYVGPGSKAYSRLMDAVEALLRARDLTTQLLTFARGGDPIRMATSLGTLIKDTIKVALHGSSVKCSFDIPDDLWMGDVDPGQMSQVLQNIIINARQSMPDGGVVDICCGNVSSGEKEDERLSAGEYVRIVVSDEGYGIHEKYLDQIFDPYFSTKPGGSGLGLAICHSIIQKHNGRISVWSEPGKGTSFTLYIPAATREAQQVPFAEAVQPDGTLRAARILVMDDEIGIRKMLKEMLSVLGQEVLLAKDGREAISIYGAQQEKGVPIDLVIMDLTVPGGMGGKDAVQEILKINPEAKVVVVSGYSQDPVLAHYQEYGFQAALGKPFQLDKLEGMLEKVLE